MTIADTLRDLEQELFKVSVRKDAARLADLLADDFREFGSSAHVYTKAEIIDTLRDEVPVTITMQDFRLVPLAEDVALVTYRAAKVQEDAPVIESLRSSVWRFADGRWQIVFHQGTKMCKPA